MTKAASCGSRARTPLVVGFSDQRDEAPWYATITQGSRSLSVRKLDTRSSWQQNHGGGELLDEIQRAAGDGEDLVVAIEGGRHRRHPAFAAVTAILSVNPQAPVVQLDTWEVLVALGFPRGSGGFFPPEAQVFESIGARVGTHDLPAGFWPAWTAAVALVGAEQVWGTTNLTKPQHAASRRRKAPEQVGEHRVDRDPPRPAPAALSLAQVAALLGVDRTTAYRLAECKEFASFRVGRQIRVHRTDLEAYLSRTRRPSAEETAMRARGNLIILPRVSLVDDDEDRGHRLADELGLK